MEKSLNNKYVRGSEWRKWDLHIHSPHTILNNQYPKLSDGTPDWESFVAKVEALDIAVLAITDYFTIDGYKKLKEFKQQGRLANIHTILPNIEFRLNSVISSKKDGQEPRRLNFHVIFSDEVPIRDIEEHFLHDLAFFYEGNPQDKDDKRKLKISNLEELGTKLISQHKQFQGIGFSSLGVGAMQAVVNHEDITEILNSSDRFRGKYLLIFPEQFYNLIDWNGQDHQIRKGILQKSDMVFSSNFKTVNWCLAKEPYMEGERSFVEEFKTLKPCIHGSDAHSINEIGHPCALRGMQGHECVVDRKSCELRHCWIKADPTFEGLRQVLYEPKSGERVFIGGEPPVYKNPSKVIDRVEIKKAKNWFGEDPILLNENLVSIIGEKGSGKTALADLISYVAGDFIQDEKDQTSFIYKAMIPTKQITETIADCEVIIYWKNGDRDIASITEDFIGYEAKGKVRYLSQSFIEKRCRPENFEELQHEIENVIFQHINTTDRLGETTFEGLRRRKTEGIGLKKLELQSNILEFNKDIFDLERDIASLEGKRKEKASLEKEVTELETQKPKPATDEEEKVEKKLMLLNEHRNSLESEIANFKSRLTTIDNVRAKLSTLKTYAEKQLVQMKRELADIDLIYDKIEFSVTPDFLPMLEEKKKYLESEINKLEGLKKVAEGEAESEVEEEIIPDALQDEDINNLTLADTNEWVSKLESVSTIVETTRKTIKDFDDKIAKIKKRIKELEQSISEIENVKKSELPLKEGQREATYKELFAVLEKEKETLEELYAPLKERLVKQDNGKENHLEFFARIELDVEEFFRKAQAVLDFSRKGQYRRGEDRLLKRIKGIAETIEIGEVDDISGEMKKFYKSFIEDEDGSEISTDSQILKGKENIDFYNWIFDTTDFKVAYNIKYQGTSLELLSPGKKGVVLLLMYLVLDMESSVPLVIDQPEENLDNKSVFPSLVDYFRELKRRRQVIVITHNPNLVLNTDAEQVIVANFDATLTSQPSRITYISGAIENSFVSEKAKIPLEERGIREHGLDILEGGKTAFRKRREKYGKTAE